MAPLKSLCAATALALCVLPGVTTAQTADPQTLADLRQDLTVLYVEMQRMRRELSTTGSTEVAIAPGSAADRMTSIEGELQRITGKVEQLEFRIDHIVKDGTNRIGDLEFRLVELEGGDVSKLGETSTLGGGAGAPITPAAQPAQTGSDAGTPAQNGVQLAVGEQADFDEATALMTQGDHAAAAQQFQTFAQNYPGSPLETQALLMQGRAHENNGDTREAARAFLEAYTGNQTGPQAPEALFRLGRALGKLAKISEACVTLGEVLVRHPGSDAAIQAEAEMLTLNCG